LLFGLQVDAIRLEKRDKHGRQTLPPSLPRGEIEHDLSDAGKPCPGCR
jgi:hypothetical protein